MKIRSLVIWLVTIILLTLIFLKIDLVTTLHTLARVKILLFFAALLLFLPVLILSAIRWQWLVGEEANLSLRESVMVTLVGNTIGTATPARAGDLSKPYLMQRKGSMTLTHAATLFTLEKAFDVFALLVLTVLGLLLLAQQNAVTSFLLLISFIGIACFVFGMIFAFFGAHLLRRWQTLYSFFQDLKNIDNPFLLLLISLALRLTHLLQIFLLFVALGITPSVPQFLGLVPAALLLGQLPITLAGMGTRDSGLIFLFQGLYPASTMAAIALLISLLYWIIALLGLPFLPTYLARINAQQKMKNVGGNYFQKHTSKNPFVKYLMWQFHDQLLLLIKKAHGKALLDVGCGEGFTTEEIRKATALKIKGIELEADVVEQAKKLHPNISFAVGSAYEIDERKESYDLVLASEVLEHLEEPETALIEMKRVSRKYCVFSVPNEPWWRIVNVLRGAYLSDLGNTPGHLNHWSKRSFEKMLKKHFKHVEVRNALLWNMALCEK